MKLYSPIISPARQLGPPKITLCPLSGSLSRAGLYGASITSGMCDVALISVTAIFGESSLLGLKQSITSPTKIPLSKTTASPGSIYI